jgi:peptidoglycan/xylan/chitin deacetylase (PgdA/CDA1 family)
MELILICNIQKQYGLQYLFIKKIKLILYLHHTPIWIQKILPSFIWKKRHAQKVVHLTFDDGPIPEVTPWVLNVLKTYNAKATFFCVGENVKKHPQIYTQIISESHIVGNHTYNHLKGIQTSDAIYLSNMQQCAETIARYAKVETPLLFRPPYGRLKFSQAKKIRELNYEIVLWDVLSGDFDKKLSKEKCLKASLKHTKSGSIVVFHDNIKSFETLQYVLPLYLKTLTEKGYKFETL